MARLMAVALTIALAGRAAGAQTCSTTVVSRDELIAAMREEQGYNLVATTNWARFQTYVFLRLARAARARDSSGRKPILIRAEDWFWNYVAVAGLNPDSARTIWVKTCSSTTIPRMSSVTSAGGLSRCWR